MDDREKEISMDILKDLLFEFETNPPQNNSEKVKRIVNAYGDSPKKENIVKLTKKMTLNHPIKLINPSCFVDAYKELKK